MELLSQKSVHPSRVSCVGDAGFSLGMKAPSVGEGPPETRGDSGWAGLNGWAQHVTHRLAGGGAERPEPVRLKSTVTFGRRVSLSVSVSIRP